MEAVLFWYTSRPDASMQLILTNCDVTTCNNNSHLNHVVTCLATMSSLMRTKSRRWSAAMPNALWMLCKSAAMSGSKEDSVQRWLQKVHTHTHVYSQSHHHFQTFHWRSFDPVLTFVWSISGPPGVPPSLPTYRGFWASCIRGSWDTRLQILLPLLV